MGTHTERHFFERMCWDEVARRIGEHQSGVRDHRKPLWTLLMFQLWYERWLG